MSHQPRFVFVAGLHRTGTSILSRILGSHPAISSIEGAPVPENEGCYLQGAIPHTAQDGRPGHFATDPGQHLTEHSPYNTLETQQRLLSDWSGWFDRSHDWWLEKSPVNLTRMRLYQQLFPTSQFIVILRHPQIMAAALAKWVDEDLGALVAYALDGYDLLRKDLSYLHAVQVIRYEDLITCPDAVRRSLLAFLDLDDHDPGIVLRDGNADYDVPESVEVPVAERMRQWGYLPGGDITPRDPYCSHPFRATRERALEALLMQNCTGSADDEEIEQKANIRQ